MAFVKELRLAALSRQIYITSDWEDSAEVWNLSSFKFPLAKYDINYTSAWTVEKRNNFNTFGFMGRNTDDDVYIDEDSTVWEDLTSYYWSSDASADKLQTLDGNWEDKTQIDKTETDLGSNFKFSWAGITDTWDSLT